MLRTFKMDSVPGNLHLLVPYGHDSISGDRIERVDSISIIETQPVTYRFVKGRLVKDDEVGK